MTEQLEIRDAHGGVRRVALRGNTMILGSAGTADVQCTGSGIAAQHLRFVRTDAGVRVEPVQAGGTVAVNGEDLYCKDLDAGDVIELGDLELRWLGQRAEPAPVSRPVRGSPRRSTRTAGRASAPERAAGREPRQRARRGGVPTSLMVSGLVLVCIAVGALAFKVAEKSNWPHTPQDYVDLAKEQVANSQPQRALDTLAVALRNAEGSVRDQALALEAEIRRLLVERTEISKVQTARQEQELLSSFEARYLQGAVERPAAREFVRQCDAWLARHGELCRRNTDGKSHLEFVEQRRAQYLATAALAEPDTAADVLFAAQAALRFQWRDYKGAVARLDAFLAATPDTAVAEARAQMIADGEQWLAGKLRNIDQLLERGDRSNAERDLRQLERWSMLPQWEPQVRERLARL